MIANADDLTQMLEDRGITPLDNLAVAENVNGGYESCPLQTSPEGPVSTIAAFMEQFSDVDFKQPEAAPDTPSTAPSLTDLTGPS